MSHSLSFGGEFAAWSDCCTISFSVLFCVGWSGWMDVPCSLSVRWGEWWPVCTDISVRACVCCWTVCVASFCFTGGDQVEFLLSAALTWLLSGLALDVVSCDWVPGLLFVATTVSLASICTWRSVDRLGCIENSFARQVPSEHHSSDPLSLVLDEFCSWWTDHCCVGFWLPSQSVSEPSLWQLQRGWKLPRKWLR